MESALANASAIVDQRQKIEQYKHILSTVLSSNDIAQTKKFIHHGSFYKLPHKTWGDGRPRHKRKLLIISLLIQPRVVSFEEQDDDAVNAEAFINKASFLVSNSQNEVLILQYKICYARILDLKRKFLEATLRCYDISQIEKRQVGDETIDKDELEQALSAAVTCTILAAAACRMKVYPILQKVLSLSHASKHTSPDMMEAIIHFEDDTEELQQWDQQHVKEGPGSSCLNLSNPGAPSENNEIYYRNCDCLLVLYQERSLIQQPEGPTMATSVFCFHGALRSSNSEATSQEDKRT
ncbi:hypothetical protein V6N11_004001 [Hibiscus sabdariffa]|uniref:Uncharacterized protein n=1 Tax=Hibiscus sabdariffa TaxID=183260 RepID=A0ABR2SF35_9ROSI